MVVGRRKKDVVRDLKSQILVEEAVHVRTFSLTNSSNLSLKMKMGGGLEMHLFFFCTDRLIGKFVYKGSILV